MNTTTWTHPRTGQTRTYIDTPIFDLIPAEDAWGHRYYGADMDRVEAARYWLDEDGSLHIDGLQERGRVFEADVRKALTAAIQAVAA